MNCFETVKAVLDRSVTELLNVEALTPEQGQAVGAQLELISHEWRLGGAPNFHDALCRFGYIYCYVAAHAHLTEMACNASQEIRRLVREKVTKNEPMRVCLFGGGPGTEVLGLAKFLSMRVAGEEESITVDVLVLDRQPAWRENLDLMVQVVHEEFAESGVAITLNVEFREFDFASPGPHDLRTILDRDLYIFNHAISEFAGDAQYIDALVVAIADRMAPGSILLILDREQNAILARAREMVRIAGLQESARTGIRNLENDEQCAVVRDAYMGLIGRHPRVKFGELRMDQGAFWVTGSKQEGA